MLNTDTIDAYCRLLEHELIPATGCTEPIAIAYAASAMRDTLGGLPERMRVVVSGNIPLKTCSHLHAMTFTVIIATTINRVMLCFVWLELSTWMKQ